jgi:hypothetical protein
MKKVLITFILIVATLLVSTGVVYASSAQDAALAGLKNTNAQAEMTEGDPSQTIGGAISVLLGILSLIFLIITIYAGVMWMTASGNTDSVEKARRMLIEGAVGFVLTLSAYAFTAYVVGEITSKIIN